MAYHDDLLQQAVDLVSKDVADQTQADLRRSVSTAYYALFLLLISETVANWSRQSSRNALGRMFEHALMRKVSGRISDGQRFPFKGEEPIVVQKLRMVADSFVQLQDNRHIADYDNATVWSSTEALDEVTRAYDAFAAWQAIRNENIAQDYLVSLLIRARD
jgi:hypothetical protein